MTVEETGLEGFDLRADAVFAARNLHVRDIKTQMIGQQRLPQALVERQETILQELVNAALDLCGADLKGVRHL